MTVVLSGENTQDSDWIDCEREYLLDRGHGLDKIYGGDDVVVLLMSCLLQ
ncbi:hypothetical protein [Halocatena marina]|uniref:Uncharacterized protein n=1 Tax=Halocatena marina TaxID=2934937 RepID=A0ABD5YZ86_9EURY